MMALRRQALVGLAAIVGFATTQVRASEADCDPIDTKCDPFPAIGSTKIDCDFTKEACDHLEHYRGAEVDTYDSPDGAEFTVQSLGGEDYMSIQSSVKYLLFGRVDVEIRTTPATGLETFLGLGSFFSSSADISFRLRGAYETEATLYFFANSDNVTDTKTVSDITSDFHTYSIDWTPDSVNYLVDGEQIWFVDRNPTSGDGKSYLERPLRVFMGIQISGREGGGDAGIGLSGGEADMSEAPFTSYFRNLTITDYGGGANATATKIKQYEATDRSGDLDSFKIVKEGDTTSGGNDNKDSDGDADAGADGDGDGDNKGDDKTVTEEPTTSSKSGLSLAASLAIGFGVFSAVMICLIAGYIFYRRRRSAKSSSDTQPFMAVANHEEPWIVGYHPPVEMDGTNQPQEMDVRKDIAPVELAVPPRPLAD